MEVHWDAKDNFLYSSVPREWTYLDWFKQIINAAQEQDCNLVLSNTTEWSDVPEPLKQSIHKWNEEYYSNLQDLFKVSFFLSSKMTNIIA